MNHFITLLLYVPLEQTQRDREQRTADARDKSRNAALLLSRLRNGEISHAEHLLLSQDDAGDFRERGGGGGEETQGGGDERKDIGGGKRWGMWDELERVRLSCFEAEKVCGCTECVAGCCRVLPGVAGCGRVV